MTVIRRVIAECDHTQEHLGHEVRTCTATQELRAYSTQTFHELMDHGWAVDHSRERDGYLLVFCPDHKEDAHV